MEQVMYNLEDFIISDGVLLKYEGVEEEVIIPPGVSVIGEKAFKECEFPKTVVVPEGVQTIEDFAFYFCDLKNVFLPDSLKVIGERAFAFCSKLEKAELPCNVCDIGADAFIGCSSLTSFDVRPENKIFFVKDGCLFRKDGADGILLSCPPTFEGSFTVPEHTAAIGDYAFYGCHKLMDLTIPDTVKTLFPCSLYGLSRECEVHLPGRFAECQIESFQNSKIFEEKKKYTEKSNPDKGRTVFRTAEEILEYDRQFKQEHFVSDGMYITIENGGKSVTGCDKDIEGVVKVPDGVLHIAPSAFSNRNGITQVILPEGMRSIGEYAFAGCVNLRNIHIPDSVTNIGHKAFSDCRQLEEIVALNMLDPYPNSIYCYLDDICRNGQEPSNRRLIFEDKEFTIPVSFPKVRLNSSYVTSWKMALTLGFLAHPELYSAYDLDKKGLCYRGVSCYENDWPYAKYAMQNKKRLLLYIFENDRPDMLRFYALCGDFSARVIRESFQEPAKSAGAVKCQAFINKWLDNSLEIEPIVPRQDALYDLPGNISSEKALREWAYEICYCPEPVVRLTIFKSENSGFSKEVSVEVPECIDNIPVRFIGSYAFRGYVFYNLNGTLNYTYLKSISCGRNLRKIEGKTIPGVITIKAPAGTYARKYALKNKCKYEERE